MAENNDTNYYLKGRDIPETPAPGEAPAFWEETRIVGKPLPRVDAYERLSGSAKYPSDITLSNMIYGAVVRSPHANAVVEDIDTSRAENMPGVKAVITAESSVVRQIKWQYGGKAYDLFDPHCRFEGEAVAAVAAESLYQAWDAAKAIKVTYKKIPFTVDYKKALEGISAKVHDSGNRVSEENSSRGDTEKGFSKADRILEHGYETACELQTPMELHGCVANWDGDRLTLWESTQGVFAVQSEVADALKIPLSKIRVIGHYMGGGFGSKLESGKYSVIAALLAKESARPVKVFLTREETFLCVGNRPANTMRLKAGIKNDGTLTAFEFDCEGPSGAYAAGGAQLVDWLVRDLYTCENVKTKATDLYINTGPARPFRAPGHPQGAWALEQMMDALAHEIGMDPVDLRLKNIPNVSQGRKGQPEYTTTGLRECIEKGAQAFDWQGSVKSANAFNKESPHLKRGVGMAACLWIAGGGGPPSTVVVKMFKDGSVNLNMGASDIGTGTKTVMAVVVSEELGVDPSFIQIENADTGTTRYATGSGGSKTVPTEAPTVRNAAIDLKRKLLEMASKDLELPMEDLEYQGDRIISRKSPEKKIKITQISDFQKRGVVSGTGYRGENPENKVVNPFAAQFCDLEVNIRTGEIKLLRFLGAHDSGRVMNRLTYDNQVHGGIVMGIGFGMTEFRQLDLAATGKVCNRNWHDYKLPTALDIPEEIVSLPVELDDPEANNTGAKGLGEPVTIPTAAAIANAVCMATGIRFFNAPLNPLEICRRISEKTEG